jgi:hypothetical protein
MKNAVIWDVKLCVSCKNLRSFEMLVLTRPTQHNIPENCIFFFAVFRFGFVCFCLFVICYNQFPCPLYLDYEM